MLVVLPYLLTAAELIPVVGVRFQLAVELTGAVGVRVLIAVKLTGAVGVRVLIAPQQLARTLLRG